MKKTYSPMKQNSKSTMDMTTGPILRKLISYSIPIVLSGLLQLLFRAADLVVVGRFTGPDALAAVSASGPVSGLIITLFLGLSVGANVLAAQEIGSKQTDDFSKTVHTSVTLSMLFGVIVLAAGMFLTNPLLRLLKTPEQIMPQARTYLLIIFFGVPGTIIYNFGAAILRAVGDTRRPMFFMLTAGILNFVLNVLFVAGFGMGVEGVAIATSLSGTLSAVLVLRVMFQTEEIYRLDWRKLRIYPEEASKILKIGLPAGLQGSAFSVSYLLVQSSINSLGPTVMAAVTIAWSIDDFCYVGVNALGQAAASFSGQNYGARKYDRIRLVYRYSLGIGVGILIVLGVSSYFFEPWLYRIFTTDAEVIRTGKQLMFLIGVFGFVNATMEIPFNVVRGMGRSTFPMVSSLLCICLLRVVWVCTVFTWMPTVTALFLCFPIAKGLCSITGILYYYRTIKATTL